MLPEATMSAPRGDRGARLLLAERGGDLGLVDVVGAGAAAAEMGVGDFAEFHARESRAAVRAARVARSARSRDDRHRDRRCAP